MRIVQLSENAIDGHGRRLARIVTRKKPGWYGRALKVDAATQVPAGAGLPWFGGRLDAADDAVGDRVADGDGLAVLVGEVVGDFVGLAGGDDAIAMVGGEDDGVHVVCSNGWPEWPGHVRHP